MNVYNSKKKSDRYYVYIHIDNDTTNVFYVGKGTGNRAFAEDARNDIWNAYVSKLNSGYTVEIVSDDLEEYEAYDLEIELIEEYGFIHDDTGTLTNIQPGGDLSITLTIGGDFGYDENFEIVKYSANEIEHLLKEFRTVNNKFCKELNLIEDTTDFDFDTPIHSNSIQQFIKDTLKHEITINNLIEEINDIAEEMSDEIEEWDNSDDHIAIRISKMFHSNVLNFLNIFKTGKYEKRSYVTKIYDKNNRRPIDFVEKCQEAMQLEKKGNAEEAITIYEFLVGMKFDGSHPYDRLAILYRKKYQYEKEISVLRKLIPMLEGYTYGEKKLNKYKSRLNKAISLNEK